MAEVGKIIFAVVVADLVLKGIKNFNLWKAPAIAPSTKDKLPGKDLATASLNDVMAVIKVLKSRPDMGELFNDVINPQLFFALGWERVRLIFKLNDQYIVPFEKTLDERMHLAAFKMAWTSKEDLEPEDTVDRLLRSIGCEKMFERFRIKTNSQSVGSYDLIYNFVIELTPEEYVNITKNQLFLVIKKETADQMGSLGTVSCLGKHVQIREDTLNFIKTQEI